MTFRLPVWARPSDILDLLRLSVPIAVSRMSMMLMSLTDAIVLGLNAPAELPYILNSWLPMGISLGLGMGLLLGVQILTSELMGVDEGEQSGRVFRRGFALALGLSFLLGVSVYLCAGPFFHSVFVDWAPGEISVSVPATVVAAETASASRILAIAMPGFMISALCSYYLEALRRPLIVTVVSYAGVAANLLIDLALVAGWWGVEPMGADGVAWATTGTRTLVALLLMAAVVFLTPALNRSQAGPDDEPRRQINVGIGTAISNVAEWGGFNTTHVIATWISLVTSAVYGYAMQIMGVCFMLFLAIGTATSVRVAEAFGRNDQQQVRNAARLGVVATLLVGAVLGILTLCFNDFLSGLMVQKDKAEIDGVLLAPIIASMLIFAAVATMFDGLQAVAAMALRAQNVIWVPMVLHIGSFFFLMIPLCYWLGIVRGQGISGMMLGVTIALVVAGLTQTLLLEWKSARLK